MTDIGVDPVQVEDVVKEPERLADLRPFIRRLRAAEAERVRLAALVTVNDLECSAARQEFDDAAAKVLDVLIVDDDVKGGS